MAALASVATAAFAASAGATTFAERTVEELVRESDVVVLGRVVDVTTGPAGPSGQPGIHTRAIIEVDETWRGEPRPLVDVWVQGGRLGDRLRVVPGQATFGGGEEIVLLLFEAGGALWPAGMGRGKWTVDRAPRPAQVTPSSRDGLTLSRSAPRQESIGGLTLAELRERVAAVEAAR